MTPDLCFVAMPFGRKDHGGRSIDFDAVYRDLIAPAIERAGLKPLRADQEEMGGIIHKPMFERLLLCRYAVVDLTFANPNVYYELGVRHTARPASTVLIMAEEVRLPFDVALLRTMPYRLGSTGKPARVSRDVPALRRLLEACKKQQARARADDVDSPVYQLLDGVQPPRLSSDKTDAFREQVALDATKHRQLAAARQKKEKGRADVVKLHRSLGALDQQETSVVIDLLLSYRAVSDWTGMVRLTDEMPAELRATVMIQEQRALALNRLGRRGEAERLLIDLIAARGPSSETLGILGRVYKDQWEAAAKAGQRAQARGFLRKAIDAYRRGFESDWRDHYPGINAVTLMELADPPDPAREELLPLVRYAVKRRIEAGGADYWDYATQLELSVLARDRAGAERALEDALTHLAEGWSAESTERNLRLIREAREGRGEETAWVAAIEGELQHARGAKKKTVKRGR